MRSIKLFLALMTMIALCFTAAWWNAKEEYGNTSMNAMSIQNTEKEEPTEEHIPTIMLDAGHGGYDSGSISYEGVTEKELTLQITLLIGEILALNGYDVLYTRTSDEVAWDSDNLSDLQKRVSLASANNADYYISIHTNSSVYQDGAYGFETYLNYQNDTMIAMAEHIHKELSSLHYSIDRGLKSTQESSLYVIDYNSVPALLLEIGFITDSDDAWFMINSQEALAQAIADGIMNTIPLT